MATTFFLTNTASDITGALVELLASLTRGGSLATSTTNTVTGPVAPQGLILTDTAGGTGLAWYTNPLNAVTISGSITANLWMSESAIQANATAEGHVFRTDGTGAFIGSLWNLERGTEMGTTRAAQNWSGTPTSTALNAGDRLAFAVYANDATAVTMASGRTISFGYNGATGAADGDSFFTFTETITEQTVTAKAFPFSRRDVARGLIQR